MQPVFDLDKIKFSTNPSTFKKAVALYESGKVTKFQEGIGAYSAVVLGTKPYRVSVEACRYGLATCACYLGQNDTLCKHMVAVSIYAVLRGKKIKPEDAKVFSSPVCSGKIGKLSDDELKKIKQEITSALKYIKAYGGPSRTWFAYQASLLEGRNRLAKIVSELPVEERTAELLLNLILRLDKKLCTGGVDDSDGTIGGFMEEVLVILREYARLDPKCKKVVAILKKTKTCFGWEITE